MKQKIEKSIKEEEANLNHHRQEKSQLPERVEATSLEKYDSFKKVDNEGKNLFDLVTSAVWNARKQLIDWLQPHFNHKNEIVDLFYAISNIHNKRI